MTAVAVALAGSLSAIGSARARDPSSTSASDLVDLMKARRLTAFAVQDPATPGRFVAAMAVPGVQLLVLAATSASPEYLQSQLAKHEYQDVYVLLGSTAVRGTQVFFQDMGCDGLSRDGDAGTDMLYERGTAQTIFNGDWKSQKMAKAAYEEKFQTADTEYSKALALLTASLRGPAAAPATGGTGYAYPATPSAASRGMASSRVR